MLRQLTIVFLALLSHWSFAQKYEGDSCVDSYTGTVGRCADVEKCDSARQDFLSNGIRPTPCGFKRNTQLVCCRDGTTILDTAKPPPPTQAPDQYTFGQSSPNNRYGSNNRRGGITSLKKCREYSRPVVETVAFIPLSLNPTKTEISGVKCDYYGTELIIGGEKAKLGEFPHMAAIGWANFNGGYNFDCGGSLISERFVLSAGHCTYSANAATKKPAVVRLGDQNLDPKVRDGAKPVEVGIKNIIKHPEYRPPARYNDIALFELATDVDFSKHIRPACLWTEPDFGTYDKALATGWGITETGSRSNDLLKVSLSIMDNSACNISLSEIINRKWSHGFDDTQMCAGETRVGKDTCQGDSGSPLQVVADENQCIFKLIGITSFGPTICGNNPAVYSRVSSYVGWIESVVWPNE